MENGKQRRNKEERKWKCRNKQANHGMNKE
jgi:hypothetical protein